MSPRMLAVLMWIPDAWAETPNLTAGARRTLRALVARRLVDLRDDFAGRTGLEWRRSPAGREIVDAAIDGGAGWREPAPGDPAPPCRRRSS